MENDWALAVGINHYPLASAVLPSLHGAVRDAVKFHQWVLKETGGHVPEGHTLLLTSPEDPASLPRPRPFHEELQTFFGNLRVELRRNSGRRLYMYLSGHGISSVGTESFHNAALVMADSSPPDAWTSFTGNVWARAIQATRYFEEVVLIMDCCRDVMNEVPVDRPNFGMTTSESKDSRLVEIYAARWASKAREGEFGEPKEKQGIFTHSLLEVLNAGKMKGSLLKASVLAHLNRKATQDNPYRPPEMTTDDDLAMLTFNEDAPDPLTQVTVRNHPAPPVIEYWRDDSDEAQQVDMNNWNRNDDTWTGQLPPGQYELRLPAPRLAKRLRVYAAVPAEVTA